MSKMSPRAVIYTRVSAKEHVNGFSLKAQRERCVTYCTDAGFHVARTFTDNGESATTVDRPAFQEMLAFCIDRENQISFVVVHDAGRLSRNIVDYTSTVESLKSAGVSLRSASENLDDTPAGRLLKEMMTACSQLMDDLNLERQAGEENGHVA